MSERMFPFLTKNHKKTGDTCNPLSGKCLISHGGAQHDTIAVVEERVTVTGSYQK